MGTLPAAPGTPQIFREQLLVCSCTDRPHPQVSSSPPMACGFCPRLSDCWFWYLEAAPEEEPVTAGHALLTFTIAAGLLTITPGLDTALVLRTAALEGPRRALLAAGGIALGLLTWGLAAALGIGVVLAVSHTAYNIVRFAGAAYLIYLGITMLFRRHRETSPMSTTDRVQRKNDSSSFLRGYLTNLLNPKVGVFYLTFLPQFVPAHVPVVSFSMLLAFIHACEGILWLGSIGYAIRFFSGWMRRPAVLKSIDRLTGTVLAGFGLELLFERR
jgi:threonine/homoserine/homoserine lactone efflux protein